MTASFLLSILVMAAQAAFWFWVYFRLEQNETARRVWEQTWVRWTAWQSPVWVLVFAIAMALVTLLMIWVAIFPEHAINTRR